ncbi:MFS transporter [Microvirga roseola]|uniref:MFS transporter n=1 Tax=Microvirga roseola TaxID=2883126 RepID=UPI001E5D1B0C|nr:MFS transporter [Microvirga roseola]
MLETPEEGHGASAQAVRSMFSPPVPKSPPYRWIILGIGVLAQAALAALQHGLSGLAPVLRSDFSLSLPEVGLILAAANWGIMSTLLLWGKLADRCGERVVIAVGLGASSLAILAASFVQTADAFMAWLFLAGALGSAASAASGRAVMHWFTRAERGLALGIRQMSIPLGSAVAAVTLPVIAAAAGVGVALAALAGAAFLGAVCAALWLSSPPAGAADSPRRSDVSPLKDKPLWRLAFCAGLLVCSQVAMNGFVIIFLAEYRRVEIGLAALVLAIINIGGGVGRVLAGRLSDVSGRRIPPIRSQALFMAVALIASALLVNAPLVLLVPVLITAGTLAISWNGLAITAAAEMAGYARAGTAIGLQGTVIRLVSAGAGIAFGFIVEQTGSWTAAFVALGVLPLVSYQLLAPLAEEEERRLGPKPISAGASPP